MRAELTPRRIVLGGAALTLGLVAAILLDTHFPESTETINDPVATKAAHDLLLEVAAGAGGMKRWSEVGVVHARIRDQWRGPFSGLSIWRTGEVVAGFSVRDVGVRHDTAFQFADGVRWGYDGLPWIAGAESVASELIKIERLSFALSQLVLLPFSAITSGSKAELIAPDIISIRFKYVGTGLRTEEWRLYVDPATKRISAVVLPLTVSDPSPHTRCEVMGWITVDGISLPSGFRCALANRLRVDLHTLEISELTLGAFEEGMFSAPQAKRDPT